MFQYKFVQNTEALKHFITSMNHFYTAKLPAYLLDILKACGT